MRWPLVTRGRHDRVVNRLAVLHGSELAQQQRTMTGRALEFAGTWVAGRADSHDLDADHLDKRPPGGVRTPAPLTADVHRVVADELRELVRDLEQKRQQS